MIFRYNYNKPPLIPLHVQAVIVLKKHVKLEKTLLHVLLKRFIFWMLQIDQVSIYYRIPVLTFFF